MRATPSTELITLGAAEIWLDRFDANGVSTGFHHLGNCSAANLSVTTEEITVRNWMTKSRGIYKRINRQVDVAGTITSLELSVLNLALVYLGTVAKTNQAGATVTAEALTPVGGVVLGKFYKTSQRQISAVTINIGVTPLVAYNPATGTGDYKVYDAAAGLIQILETPTTGALVEGADLTIDYTSAALTAATALDIIKAGSAPQIEGKLFLVSDNVVGPNYDVEMWRAGIRGNGELALIGEDIVNLGLAITGLDDSAGRYGGSEDNPFFQKVFRAAA